MKFNHLKLAVLLTIVCLGMARAQIKVSKQNLRSITHNTVNGLGLTSLVGDSGTAMFSLDSGISWQPDTINTKLNLRFTAGSTFVNRDMLRATVGDSGSLFISYKKNAWKRISTPTRQTQRGLSAAISWSGSEIFTVGDSGTILCFNERATGQKVTKIWGDSTIRFNSICRVDFNSTRDQTHNYPFTTAKLLIAADSGRIYQLFKNASMPAAVLFKLNTDSITRAQFNTITYNARDKRAYAFAADGKAVCIVSATDSAPQNYFHIPASCSDSNQVLTQIENPFNAWDYRGIFSFGKGGCGSTAAYDNVAGLKKFTCFKTGTNLNINGAAGISGDPNIIAFVTDNGYVHVTNRKILKPSVLKANGAVAFCKGLGSVTITDTTASVNADYQWYKNGRLLRGANSATLVVTDSGNYYLNKSIFTGAKYTRSNGSNMVPFWSDTNSNRIHVQFLPQPVKPVITVSGTDSLAGPVVGATKYRWLRDTTLLTDTTGKIKATVTGSYRVIAYNAGGCKSDTSAPYNFLRCADINRLFNFRHDTVICQGGNLLFRYTPNPSVTGLTYQWFKNGIAIATGGQSNLQTVTDSGRYSLQIRVLNCLVFSDTIKVSISSVPSAPTVSPSGAIDLCSGDSVILTGQPGFSRYIWIQANGQIIKDTTGNKLVLKTSVGGLRLKVNNQLGCASPTSQPINITARTRPTRPVLSLSGRTITATLTPAVPAAIFKWYKNGVLVPGTIGTTLTNATPGASYKAVAFVATCVSDTSVVLTVTGIKSTDQTDFKMFPNPNNGNFNISCAEWLVGGLVTITDLAGKEIYNSQLQSVLLEINLPELSPGLFILNYRKDNYQMNQRLMIR